MKRARKILISHFLPGTPDEERRRPLLQHSSHYFWHGSRRRRRVSDNGNATPSRSDRRGLTGPSKEASFFLPPSLPAQMRNGVDWGFRLFLPKCKMKRNEPTCNISSVPRMYVQNGHLFGYALQSGTRSLVSWKTRGFRIDRPLVFDVGRWSQGMLV